jgi:hypothetical protein
MNVVPGASIEFDPDSEPEREALVLWDDLVGAGDHAYRNLRDLKVPHRMASTMVVAQTFNAAFAGMEHMCGQEGHRAGEEFCLAWCKEQFRLFKEGCGDEQG